MGSHACAVILDGSVRCWGSNGSGELGDGTRVDRSVPVTVAGLGDVLEVAGGWEQTCARLVDGSVRCWGDNAQGQLGDGTTTRRAAPVQVHGITDAIDIAGDGWHECAVLADGSIRCWGSNGSGELGDGTRADRHEPVAVKGITTAIGVAAAPDGTCALLADGTARCWGLNEHGQLGDGTTTDSTTPVQVTGLAGAVSIGMIGVFEAACALLGDMTVSCWGSDEEGQLGDGKTADRHAPGPVPEIADAAALSPGAATCVVRASRAVTCWGFLGQEDGRPAGAPGITNAAAVAAADNDACVLLGDGSLRCWGANESGELGSGLDPWEPVDEPEPVVGIGAEGTDTDQPTRPGRPTVAIRVGATLRGQSVPVIVRWVGSSDPGSGLATPAYVVESYTPDSVGSWGPIARASGTAAAATLYAGAGTDWQLRVVVRDVVGHANTSRPTAVRRYTLLQETSRQVIVTPGWRWVHRDAYSGHATRTSTRAGAAAWYTFTGRGIALVTTTGPTRGKVRIYLDGRRRATVDLWRSSTTYRTVAWAATWPRNSRHTVRVVVVGTPGRPRVDLDAFVVTR